MASGKRAEHVDPTSNDMRLHHITESNVTEANDKTTNNNDGDVDNNVKKLISQLHNAQA